MKRTLLLAGTGLLLVWGAAACTDKESQSHVPAPEFFLTAQKDGAGWLLPGTAVYLRKEKQFAVTGYVAGASTGEQEFLRLNFTLPLGQPHSAVQPLSAEWGRLVGGDVLSNSYTAAEAGRLPSIEITRLDTVAKLLEGRFQATLRRDKHWTKQVEEMTFGNGTFRVRYQVAK